MMKNYATFNLGNSFFQDRSVVGLVRDQLPVSISIGLWTTLLTYLVSIPLGIRKAVQRRQPLRHLVQRRHHHRLRGAELPVRRAADRAVRRRQLFLDVPAARPRQRRLGEPRLAASKIVDYFWHIALPITALSIGGFATLTMLTKNCFLDEINKQYVLTARAKGLTERRVLYGHVFRNAMLLVVAGFPAAFVAILFSGALADRGDLLAGRARPSRLRGGDQPRLPDHVRHALRLHADRAWC